MLPKAELHVHLEGTITPELARKLAKRNGMVLPEIPVTASGSYYWKDFLHFLSVFDDVSNVLKTPEDYRDITYDYLRRCAAQEAIYVELMASPDHARLYGVAYPDFVAGIAAGIDAAKADFGIESRIISVAVRHFGCEAAIQVAQQSVKYPHPYVVGYGLGGDEKGFPARDFVKAYDIARKEAGLALTAHAGEMDGPQSVRDAIELLHVTRVGHGVRSIEDSALLDEIIARDITLEVCITSNLVLRVYPNLDAHPFLKLLNKGVKVTLNSDDPPFFDATLGGEYELAERQLKLSRGQLLDITRTAINSSFAEATLKKSLLASVAENETPA